MKDRELVTYAALAALTIIVILVAIFSEDPIREGYISGKHYTPRHWVSTGKSGYVANESWGVSITRCGNGTTTDCGYGHFSVSEDTYYRYNVGDYIRFDEPSPFWYAVIRLFLFACGIGCVWLCGWMALALLEDFARGGGWLEVIMSIMAIALLIFAEGIVFLGTKGPDGLIS